MLRATFAAIFFMSAAVHAADTQSPTVIPAPNGAVILATDAQKRSYEKWRYAAVRRVDNMLYLSGVIVARRENEGKDVAALKVQTRRAFEQLKASLEAAGASFADVVMVNSFHVWDGPNFSGTRDEQFDAFYEVVGEYVKAPYPAWTAVGTTGLLSDRGIVEVQMIARLPDSSAQKSASPNP